MSESILKSFNIGWKTGPLFFVFLALVGLPYYEAWLASEHIEIEKFSNIFLPPHP